MPTKNIFKKEFESKLDDRFRYEFEGAPFETTYMRNLKKWWMNDQGLNRSNNLKTVFNYLKPFLPNTLERLKCLDVGCGNGASLLPFENENVFCTGIEYDPSGLDLELAKLRCTIYDLKPNLVNGDALSLPFNDGAFDLCISLAVLEHIKDFEKHIHEIHRVLKSKGIAYFYTRNRFHPYDSHTRSYFIQWLPHKFLEWYWNATVGFERRKQLPLWPLSILKLKKALKQNRFNIVSDPKGDYLKSSPTSLKQVLMKSLIKFGIPLEILLSGSTFIVKK